MKRKLIAGFLSVCMVTSIMLSGCGTAKTEQTSKTSEASSKSGEKHHIRMAYWNKEDSVKTFLKFVKDKLPDVDLEFQFIDIKNYSIVNTQLAAGEGPDLLCGAGSEADVKAGYYLDITDMAFVKKYSPEILSQLAINGRSYGIPGISWFEGMFYNKEIFDKYGLKPPKTFDDLMAIHEKLQKEGVKPQAMGAKSWEPMMKSSIGFAMNEFIMTDAGKGFDKGISDGTKTFDKSLNASLNAWSQYIKKGYINKEMLGIDYEQALDEFATGKAAMWESGPWAVETIKKKNPNLKFDMFPFYGSKPDTGWLIGGPGLCFGVNAKSPEKASVVKVLEILSTPEGQRALWEDNKGGSSFMQGIEFPMPEEYASCAEVFKASRVYCPWLSWGNDKNAYIEEYGKAMQEYLAGKKTIDEVLQAVDKKSTELRKKRQ